MNARKFCLACALALGGLALATVLISTANTRMCPVEAQSSTSIIRVAITGADGVGCGSAVSPPCRTIQYAVDQAIGGEEIRVAAGTYTGVQTRAAPPGYADPPASGVITQVVYVGKAVTIRGGYTTTNGFAGPPNPASDPTIVDAQQQGRAMVVSADAAIAGLRLTSGDATGLGGHPFASSTAGGGVYLYQADGIVLEGNTIDDNQALSGGGIYAYRSNARLSGNAIFTNTATGYHYDFYGGGGVYLYESDALLRNNTIVGNWGESGHGGGVYLRSSDAILSTVIKEHFQCSRL